MKTLHSTSQLVVNAILATSIKKGVCPVYTLFLAVLFVLPWNHFAAQSGAPDLSFGLNGQVTTGFGFSEVQAQSMAIQSDGKVICAGTAYLSNTNGDFQGDSYCSVIFRFNTDGSPDASFGSNGVVVDKFPFTDNNNRVYTGIYFVKVLDDGKILTYGYRGVNVQYGGFVLCKYNADGSVDSSFGTNGMVDSAMSPLSGGTPMVVQTDNKIVVLGALIFSSTSLNTSSFLMARYNADGSLDTSFADNGQAVTTFGFALNYPVCLALQADGKILASGTGNGRILVARYAENGLLDNTFDGDGKVITAFGIFSGNSYLRVMDSGKIQVAGLTNTTTGNNFSVTQYNANGSLDTSFDGDGRSLALFDPNETSYLVNSVTQQEDDKFLVSTLIQPMSEYENLEDFVTRRYNADGSIDNTFGDIGKATTSLGLGSISKGISVQLDGKILVVGFTRFYTQYPYGVDVNVLRYESNGVLDPMFGVDGVVSEKLESSNDNGRVVLKQDDGKLVVIGVRRYNVMNTAGNADFALARYNEDGSLDNTFGVNGKRVVAFGQHINTVRKGAFQPDGKILVLSEFYEFPSSNGQEVVRFNSDGSLDTSFGTGGAIAISSAYFSSLSALSVMADGSFFVINHGYSPLDNSEPFALYLTCFNSDGSVNTSFGNAGTVYFEGIFYSDVDPQIIVQPDGKILVSSFQQNLDGLPGMSLMRLNSDGSLDTNFESTMLSVDVGAYPHAIFLEPDGKIIMAGQRAEVNETYLFYNFLTVRYLADGSVDTNYGNNGITKTFLGDQIGALNTVVKSIVRQDDGKFLVGLTRNEQYPANPPLEIYDFVLYRFTADGEYDTSFGFAGKVTLSFFDQYDELYAVVLQSDHKIVLAGTTDNGATRDFALARLQNCIDVASEVNVTVCAGASYSLDNETYTASGDYQAVLTSASGCDSLVTLHLTVLPAASYAQSISLCAGESVTINGETYTNSGVYQTLVTTANGCDSTITTSLFVDNLQAQIMSNNQNLAAIDYPENALFQWLDCDNMENPIPGATDAVFEPAVTGSYAVQVSNASCSATSVCEDFTVVGVPTIGDQADFDFSVFPNPVQNDFLLGVSGCVWPCSFALLDAQGREMLNEIILQKEVRISLDALASGVYLLKVVDALGNERTKRIVKE